jgi:hypothetical protein
MYQFSRSIYRQLAPRIEADDEFARSTAQLRVLEACEATIRRLVADRYFARPKRTLFNEVREYFALAEQVHVYMVIERYLDRAVEYFESLPDEVRLDGVPRQCPASTRKGTPCKREPRPGRDYCPSHMHLEESFGTPSLVNASQAA